MPPTIPATVPVVFTVATVLSLLLQVPPVVVSVSVIVVPAQKADVPPPIEAGSALMVMGAVTVPQPLMYEIVVVPGLTPVTTPDVELMVKLPLLAVQVPKPMGSLSIAVEPTQTLVVVIGSGAAETVTFIVVDVVAEPSDTCTVNASGPV